ncbi:sugar-binding protein, partial [Bacteroidota bacterium]
NRYTCYRTLSEIVIDGSLDDTAWRDVPWSLPFADIEGGRKPSPPLETRMKMAWDDSCLYIAARLIEPHLFATFTDRDAIIFHDPDFEVFVDPDGDTRNYYEFEINALGTEMDLFMPKSYKKGGKYDITWNLEGIRSAVKLEGTLNSPADLDTAWTIEIAIPWSAFRSKRHTDSGPEPGTSWRINFSRVEWVLEINDDTYRKVTDPSTGKPVHEENWVWSPTGVINMHMPEHWGYADFSGDPTPPKWWVWMHLGDRSTEEWGKVLQDLDTLGIRGILLGADTATLALVASLAEPYGIDVHAWIWTMNRGDADTAWLDYNRLGESLAEKKAYVGYYNFMNPALPEVKEFLQNKFRELTSVKGLKGVHMDYIRYVDAILPSGLQPKYNLKQDSVMPQFDYGYHPYMVDLFMEQHGIDPNENMDPEADSLWLAFRLSELNKTVDLLREVVQGEDLTITAAVFPTPEMSRTMVRQKWDVWRLDTYFPMVYHRFYEKEVDWIKQVMETNKRLLPGTPVVCGLYLPALMEEDQFSKAVAAALLGGADGIALFNYGNITESIRQQIKKMTYSEF